VRPWAITVIFGLSFATVLTLFFIPVIYSCLTEKKLCAYFPLLPTESQGGKSMDKFESAGALADFAIRRPVTVCMFFFSMLAFGYV